MARQKKAPANRSSSNEGTWVRVGKLRQIKLMKGGSSEARSGCVTCTARGTEYAVPLRKVSVRDHKVSEGTILREATHADQRRAAHLSELEDGPDFAFCEAKIRELGLPMKLRAVERLYGGERIIFYFSADGRVDFRTLVKVLAREFHTRIELRQIGARDEAKLVGDVGVCGQAICCQSWLSHLKPVSLQMAKNQGRAPQGDKNLGSCGRLKCCLRFENELYTELKQGLPRIGTRMQTTSGPAEVLHVDILRREIHLRGEDGVGFVEHADDLLPSGIRPPAVAKTK
jgi:cell fate regulator YaaT (PSP1 superfamily)